MAFSIYHLRGEGGEMGFIEGAAPPSSPLSSTSSSEQRAELCEESRKYAKVSSELKEISIPLQGGKFHSAAS